MDWPAAKNKTKQFHHRFAPYAGNADERSFASILVIEGECTISAAGDSVNARKGESYLIEAGTGTYSISGNASVLITAVP